tara:strand:+ start:2709 stop:3401 length:693 start_codon:yes stop_codon:yes gene_type:complete
LTVALFWDIDGTLLSTARAGVFAWEGAIREVLGSDRSLDSFPTAGMTDAEIATKLAEECGAGLDRIVPVLRRYEELLPSCLPMRTGHVLPNVTKILDDIKNLPGVASILLTGNTAIGAQAKLTHYGLSGYFDGGAFSRHGDDRATIARRALDLARSRHGDIRAEDTYVIGDTPKDIACGKVINARTVAVATGVYTLDELVEYDPWWAIEQLPEPDEFFSKVMPTSVAGNR